jgi:hypothetical protein
VRRSISRTAALVLSVTVALGAAAVPCAAGDVAAAKARTTLTRLSPATRQLLVGTARPTVSAQTKDPGAGGSSSPGAFFHSTRGKVTIALMGVGAGFALWSIHHDRIPVKSPVR